MLPALPSALISPEVTKYNGSLINPVSVLVVPALYNWLSLANSLVEPIVLAPWLDIVGNRQPLGQIEFFGLLVTLLNVFPVNEEELFDAIAAVQL